MNNPAGDGFIFTEITIENSDIELFMGPMTEDNWIDCIVFGEGQATMADLVVEIGAFPSKSQARKNGWDRPIPPGYSAHKCGKRRFWILNRWDGMDA